jgi:mutator protein MutT
MSKYIHVVAALIIKDNVILIAQRSESKYHDAWEFPGGKVELNETPERALQRELKEELGVHAVIQKHFMDSNLYIHSSKTIKLSAYYATIDCTPKAIEHKAIKWIKINQLLDYSLLPADIPIAKKLMSIQKADDKSSA